MRKIWVHALVLCTCFLCLLPAAAGLHAAEGGYSNYIPGSYGDFGMAVAPTEKWTLRNDVYYYEADTNRSVRSGNLEIGAELTFLMNFTTLIYKPDIKLFGAQLAAGVFLPFVDVDLDAELAGGNAARRDRDSATGLGDIALIPLALYWTSGDFHTSLTQLVVAPTGNYDKDNSVNEGLNYWSFDTNFAMTYLNAETGRDLSINLGHIYNTENDATNYQTGREIHVDVAFNQFLSERFAIGLHGFFLEQITGDSGSGALLGNFKGEVAGIGPALLWATTVGNQEVTLIAKWLHEVHAENRLEGDQIYVSLVLDW